jgi:hypothetical protein
MKDIGEALSSLKTSKIEMGIKGIDHFTLLSRNPSFSFFEELPHARHVMGF